MATAFINLFFYFISGLVYIAAACYNYYYVNKNKCKQQVTSLASQDDFCC